MQSEPATEMRATIIAELDRQATENGVGFSYGTWFDYANNRACCIATYDGSIDIDALATAVLANRKEPSHAQD